MDRQTLTLSYIFIINLAFCSIHTIYLFIYLLYGLIIIFYDRSFLNSLFIHFVFYYSFKNSLKSFNRF